jgi:hypothetical protein
MSEKSLIKELEKIIGRLNHISCWICMPINEVFYKRSKKDIRILEKKTVNPKQKKFLAKSALQDFNL